MQTDFEPIFFQPLYDGDVMAAFPDEKRHIMTEAFEYWAGSFYRSITMFYRSQLWQHRQIVERAFNAKYPLDWDWDEAAFQDFAADAGLWAHAEQAERHIQQAAYFIRTDELPLADSMAEYQRMIQASFEGRSRSLLYEPKISEVWFNWQIDPDADEVRLLRRLPYREYLLTPHWKRVRAAMIIVNGARCQSDRCYGMDSYWLETGSLQVHHKTYANRGRERFADLELLCEICHKMTHGLQLASR